MHRLPLVVDFVQKKPVVHLKFRVGPDHLALKLELNDCDSLVNLHVKIQVLGIVIRIVADRKCAAVHVLVGFQGKGCKGNQIDPVALLQCVQIPIPRRSPQNRGNTGKMPAGGSHPDNIVISPLNIHGMVLHQRIHDDMRAGPSVKNIPNDMEMVNHKPLDQIA